MQTVAAHLSVYHFCKVFRKTTGRTFTDYLARTRVATVKKMLRARRMNVSETAFAAGFQSLSQCNRGFHRIVGESPTAYRNKIEIA